MAIQSEKVVEVVGVTEVPPNVPSWHVTAYSEIRNGAWAVLLAGVFIYTALRGLVGKSLDKHISLLDTMKDSLSKNATSLENLSHAEVVQNQALTKQGEALIKQGDAIQAQQAALATIDHRQKEVVTKSFSLLEGNSYKIDKLYDVNSATLEEHKQVTERINELKQIAEQHQQEVIEKLQTIEDLYHASEIATGNKGTIRNFWKNERHK